MGRKKNNTPTTEEFDFPQYNMKCSASGENVILRGIVHVVSRFPLHFMLYRGNLDYFSDSVHSVVITHKELLQKFTFQIINH